MSAWIMVMMLLANNGDSVMRIEARFETEAACIAALEAAAEEAVGHSFVGGCHPDWRE